MTNALTVTAPAGLPFIDSTREFDAPLAAVWRAHTEPDLLARWMGPRGYQIEDMTFEARPGGTWGFTHITDDGSYRFRGVVHSIEDQKSVTQTFEFDGVPGHVSLERADFEDLGNGRTRMRSRAVYQSVEDRDGMVESGMEGGMSEAYEQLDELLPKL